MSLLTVHTYKKDPMTGKAVLSKVTPYVRISAKEGPPMYLKNGHVYSEDGSLVHKNNWPEWLPEEISKCNPKELLAVKFSLKQLNPPDEAPKKRGRPKKKAVEPDLGTEDGDDTASGAMGL